MKVPEVVKMLFTVFAFSSLLGGRERIAFPLSDLDLFDWKAPIFYFCGANICCAWTGLHNIHLCEDPWPLGLGSCTGYTTKNWTSQACGAKALPIL